MRSVIFAAVIFLSACAAEEQNLAPPPGVDFSGRWKFNAADSDDPMHLLQMASAQAAAADNTANSGRGGHGGHGQGAGYPSIMPPATPSISLLADASRFPGKQLDIKQVAGIVTFNSEGTMRVCQPGDAKTPRHHSNPSDRDAPLPAERDAPPPHCAWSEKTLIVRSSEAVEDRPPYEEHYRISDNGQRLIEEVNFRGGRSSGFVMSRVWDRLP